MTSHAVGTMDAGRGAAHKLDAVSWGLFFIWIGIALLANFGWGIGLLGVGVLILGAQAARKYMALRFEAFWLVTGVFFVIAGFWEMAGIRVGLVPVFCIAAGALLVIAALTSKPED